MIKEINIDVFTNFVDNHPLRTHFQTKEYALLMGGYGYEYEYIGYFNEQNILVGAALILYKAIGSHFYYGYAPRGFLLDYFNPQLVASFTKAIRDYYYRRAFVFIKINPEIAIGELNLKTVSITPNNNMLIMDYLKDNHFKPLKQNVNFESLRPRYNAIVNLKNFSFNNVEKNVRNKVRQAERKGLSIKKASRDDLEKIYQLFPNKSIRSYNYYLDYYNIFSKNNNIDLFVIKINYQDSLYRCKVDYEEEQQINNYYNSLLMSKNSFTNLNKKMESDRRLNSFKLAMVNATKALSEHREDEVLAAAIVVKYHNRINIIISGYDLKYKKYNPNYYLFYNILDYYKNDYDFADLNGMSGNFDKDSKYYGLNKFKIGFKPRIFEFIGEYDLIINDLEYALFERNNTLYREFSANEKK